MKDESWKQATKEEPDQFEKTKYEIKDRKIVK